MPLLQFPIARPSLPLQKPSRWNLCLSKWRQVPTYKWYFIRLPWQDQGKKKDIFWCLYNVLMVTQGKNGWRRIGIGKIHIYAFDAVVKKGWESVLEWFAIWYRLRYLWTRGPEVPVQKGFGVISERALFGRAIEDIIWPTTLYVRYAQAKLWGHLRFFLWSSSNTTLGWS